MYRYDLISCHDCGVLHQHRPVQPREKARCVRCGSILYRGIRSDPRAMAAITLAAIFTFLIAQFFPIVELSVSGYSIDSTLLGAIYVLWREKMEIVATVVTLFTIVLPAVELGALFYVTLALSRGRRPPGFDSMLRALGTARRWGMTEVLMIGILITIVKMTSLARVIVHPGLFAFAVLTLMLAVVMSFDPKILWNIGEHLPGPKGMRPSQSQVNYRALAAGAPLVACHSCGLVAPEEGRHQRCVRCKSALHRRRPNSVGRTWALLLAATILYLPAMLLPVMYTNSLLGKEDDTIISGVLLFWNSGSQALAIIIFVASIAVPVLKLVALAILATTAQRRSRWRPDQRTALYRIVEFVGRWSMLDIFVITLTVALVRFQSLAVITAGPGALAFCAVVVLTMMASMQFDPRLIWDPVESHGEKHA
ncbi:paraquat-inducible protein A [Duganella sp. Leaf126]|uniref:paraquat-inducible protein A n=1 Tax=Duganella sp. Leaf126 TaxID=1736266 RepID=UPI0006F386D5|nr:paraquat-inducible protein A [Duganella sp. Leaf126]KQQ47159.1 paraquat-inducible protein A [Duganella sp. Leaf126]